MIILVPKFYHYLNDDSKTSNKGVSKRYSLTFGDEPLPNLPCENGRVLPLVLLDLGDDGRRRDFRLATTD